MANNKVGFLLYAKISDGSIAFMKQQIADFENLINQKPLNVNIQLNQAQVTLLNQQLNNIKQNLNQTVTVNANLPKNYLKQTSVLDLNDKKTELKITTETLETSRKHLIVTKELDKETDNYVEKRRILVDNAKEQLMLDQKLNAQQKIGIDNLDKMEIKYKKYIGSIEQANISAMKNTLVNTSPETFDYKGFDADYKVLLSNLRQKKAEETAMLQEQKVIYKDIESSLNRIYKIRGNILTAGQAEKVSLQTEEGFLTKKIQNDSKLLINQERIIQLNELENQLQKQYGFQSDRIIDKERIKTLELQKQISLTQQQMLPALDRMEVKYKKYMATSEQSQINMMKTSLINAAPETFDFKKFNTDYNVLLSGLQEKRRIEIVTLKEQNDTYKRMKGLLREIHSAKIDILTAGSSEKGILEKRQSDLEKRLTTEKGLLTNKRLINEYELLEQTSQEKILAFSGRLVDKETAKNLKLKDRILLYQKEAAFQRKNWETTYGSSLDKVEADKWLGSTFSIKTEQQLKDSALLAKEIETNARAARKEATLLRKDTDNVFTTFLKDLKKFALWMGASTLFFQSFRFIKQGVDFINDLNKAMTNIEMITGKSQQRIQELSLEYSNLASSLHETTLNIMQAAEEFLRAGYSQEKVLEILKASTLMSKISGQDQKATAEQLIAINNAYEGNIKNLMDVVDKMVMVDNNSATSTKELGAALERTSSSAQMAGVSFEKLVSWIATVSSVTRKSATSIGESLWIFVNKNRQNRGIAA